MIRPLGPHNCDFSQQASLLFHKNVDAREPKELRPPNYALRIIEPFDVVAYDAVWKNADLAQETYHNCGALAHKGDACCGGH